MTTQPPDWGDVDDTLGRLAALRIELAKNNRDRLLKDPKLAEALNQQVDDLFGLLEASAKSVPATGDGGLSDLIGLGPDAAGDLRAVRYAPSVPRYDDQVARERLTALADLYYIYQHERMGVFRAVLKLQELFEAGNVRLSDGPGALALYQYDRKQTLRYTQRDRQSAYRKVFGYTDVRPPKGAPANKPFHALFANFTRQASQFFQDKRVSEVVRPSGARESFGSMAVVRRAALDLRQNLKQASYGNVAVLRTEVMGLLEEAFDILAAPDIRNLFGAPGPWDTLEEVLKRHLSEVPLTSQRSRMAVAGRDVLRWLSEPYVLSSVRIDFETFLEDIVDAADDWLTSAASLSVQRPATLQGPQAFANVVPLQTARRGA